MCLCPRWAVACVTAAFWVMKQLLRFCVQLLDRGRNDLDIIRLTRLNVDMTMGYIFLPCSTQPPSRDLDEAVGASGWRWLVQSFQVLQERSHLLYHSRCHGLLFGQSYAGCVPRHIKFCQEDLCDLKEVYQILANSFQYEEFVLNFEYPLKENVDLRYDHWGLDLGRTKVESRAGREHSDSFQTLPLSCECLEQFLPNDLESVLLLVWCHT